MQTMLLEKRGRLHALSNPEVEGIMGWSETPVHVVDTVEKAEKLKLDKSKNVRVALLMVGWQSVKAAMVNPVKSLKSE